MSSMSSPSQSVPPSSILTFMVSWGSPVNSSTSTLELSRYMHRPVGFGLEMHALGDQRNRHSDFIITIKSGAINASAADTVKCIPSVRPPLLLNLTSAACTRHHVRTAWLGGC